AEALDVAGTPFVGLVDVSAPDADEAHGLAVAAWAQLVDNDLHEALATAIRAAAADPFCDDARSAVNAVRAALGPDAVGPQPLRGARPLVVALDADDVVRDPGLLAAAAQAVGDLEDVTIAVDAVSFDAAEAAGRISALADEQGFADDPRLDLALVTGPLDELGAARLAHGVTVRVSTRKPDSARPWLPLGELAAARELLLSRRPAPPA
ncbi:MAG TPA: hypothetical protein VNT55_19295, partial [Baekduia sp.]|nr:hypothetical protein [Baekduia sp.]